MYDLDPPDRVITETIFLETFYNDLSPHLGGNIPSLEYCVFLHWIFILLNKYRNQSLFFRRFYSFCSCLTDFIIFLQTSIENVHSYYNPCIQTFSVQKLLKQSSDLESFQDFSISES